MAQLPPRWPRGCLSTPQRPGDPIMALESIHSFLVHPAKASETQPVIGGTRVPVGDKLSTMLSAVFDRAHEECQIAIIFRPDEQGRQQNDRRDDVVKYALKPTLANGRRVAEALQAVTTHRSGLGLLFLLVGKVGADTRLVVSRFPADQGVVAEEIRDKLTVEFIERVFMKSARAYKSAFFQSQSPAAAFWDGAAIDRQITGPKEVSDYWIQEFLQADLRTTAAAGTRRLAVAFRGAVQSAGVTLPVRQELIAAATLMRGRGGETRSGREFVERLGLSNDAARELEGHLPRPELMTDVFSFDREEFERHLLYQLVELDNGGLLLAEASRFDQIFERELLDADDHLVRFSTEGHVVDERLRKSR